METPRYLPADKMVRLIADDYRLIHVMSRFGITVGFGDGPVNEVCEQAGVDPDTFLAIVNYVRYGIKPADFDKISVESLLAYLKRSHGYFLDYCLPAIRRKIIDCIEISPNDISFLIIKLFDEYVQQTRTHMEYEEQTVFPYIKALLEGRVSDEDAINTYSDHHEQVANKLYELKSIILKYSPAPKDANTLNDVLYDIHRCESDLENHCLVEDDILVPSIRLLERKVKTSHPSRVKKAEPMREPLSTREKEIVALVVRGLTNKEIAERLFLSPHTVITHRRNIARKLEIHSPTGLTIYAIVNHLVELADISEIG